MKTFLLLGLAASVAAMELSSDTWDEAVAGKSGSRILVHALAISFRYNVHYRLIPKMKKEEIRNLTKHTTSLQWKNRDDDNTVVWHSDPFDQGACRAAYIGFYTDKHPTQDAGKKCVVKMFLDEICWSEDKWESDMKGMRKCRQLAKEWNEFGLTNKEIEVVTGEILKQTTGQKHLIGQYVLVEPFIEGNYAKWNSNSGWVDHDALSVHSFCHWTYHTTGGEILFCDAQGVRHPEKYIITDACIMSNKAGKYGMTDCGKEAQLDWMRSHKCNDFCSSGWCRVSGASKRKAVRRSTYEWEATDVSTA